MKKPFFTIILTFFMVILPFMMIGCDTSSDSSSGPVPEFVTLKSGTIFKFVLDEDPLTYGYAKLTSGTIGTVYSGDSSSECGSFSYNPATATISVTLGSEGAMEMYLFKCGDSYYFSDTHISCSGTDTVVGTWTGTDIEFILKADKMLTGTMNKTPVTGTWTQDGYKITTNITGVAKSFETWLVKNNGTYHGFMSPEKVTVVTEVPAPPEK